LDESRFSSILVTSLFCVQSPFLCKIAEISVSVEAGILLKNKKLWIFRPITVRSAVVGFFIMKISILKCMLLWCNYYLRAIPLRFRAIHTKLGCAGTEKGLSAVTRAQFFLFSA
jgi:hypothetical protein